MSACSKLVSWLGHKTSSKCTHAPCTTSPTHLFIVYMCASGLLRLDFSLLLASKILGCPCILQYFPTGIHCEFLAAVLLPVKILTFQSLRLLLLASEISGLKRSLSVISTLPLPLNNQCTLLLLCFYKHICKSMYTLPQGSFLRLRHTLFK